MHLLSTQHINSAHRCTVRSAIQCAAMHSAQHFTAPSASLRRTLYCAQRCTVRSIVHPPNPVLHSAQHCSATSITQHRAQRAKTRPNAATEPPLAAASSVFFNRRCCDRALFSFASSVVFDRDIMLCLSFATLLLDPGQNFSLHVDSFGTDGRYK